MQSRLMSVKINVRSLKYHLGSVYIGGVFNRETSTDSYGEADER